MSCSLNDINYKLVKMFFNKKQLHFIFTLCINDILIQNQGFFSPWKSKSNIQVKLIDNK